MNKCRAWSTIHHLLFEVDCLANLSNTLLNAKNQCCKSHRHYYVMAFHCIDDFLHKLQIDIVLHCMLLLELEPSKGNHSKDGKILTKERNFFLLHSCIHSLICRSVRIFSFSSFFIDNFFFSVEQWPTKKGKCNKIDSKQLYACSVNIPKTSEPFS